MGAWHRRIIRHTIAGITIMVVLLGSSVGLAKPQVLFVHKGSNLTFWDLMGQGAQRAATELGVTVEFSGPPYADNAHAQSKYLRKKIASGAYAALALVPAAATELVPTVTALKTKQLPVLIVDSPLAPPNTAPYLGTDNLKAGQVAAEAMHHQLSSIKHAHVFRLVENSASTEQRARGFLARLGELQPQARITDSYAQGLVDSAVANARKVFKQYPTIDGIFAVNESTAIGVVKALRDSNLKQPPTVVAFDEHPILLAALADGIIHALVIQDPELMGYLGVKLSVQRIRGAAIAAVTETPVKVIYQQQAQAWSRVD